MRKHSFIKTAAVLLCGVLTAGMTGGCGHKEVSLDDEHIINYTAPEIGEEICVITVKDYGDIKIKFFPEETEKGVENFKTLVKSGFYDELIFHRIIDGFMIQSGDPKGDGTGGVDAWGGDGFAQTISDRLIHTVGAVAYAINPEDRLNQSQFYIVTGAEADDDYFKALASRGYQFSPYVKRIYNQFGGSAHLDGGYEIFGQVFDGLDVCLELQKVPTNSSDKPKSSVVIEKAEIVEYDGSGVNWLNWKGEPQSGINAEG